MFIQDDEKDESGKGASDTSSDQNDTDEEDTSDDSDESSSDSGGDEDEKETDGQGSDDILKQYAKDPNSVPKELRGAVKHLLGIHTKKMQAAASSIKKAEAFDQLVLDPEFRKWMESRRASISKGRNSRSSRDDDDDNEDNDEDSPVTMSTLRAELSRFVTQQQTAESMRQEAREFKKNHPDWELYKDDIGEVLEKHPTLSYEDAYRLVTDSPRKQTNMEAKKRANVSKPNRTTGRQVEKKGKMTVQQAFEEAKRKLGLK